MFHIGQEVICVHVEPVVNKWHNSNPIVKGRVYTILRISDFGDRDYVGLVVQRLNPGPKVIGPAWSSKWFRPLSKGKKTDITFAQEILKKLEPKIIKVKSPKLEPV